MNFLSFTHCSASKIFKNDLSVFHLGKFDLLKELSREWVSLVNNSLPSSIANSLYNGNGFKKLVKAPGNKNFFVISAGLGLINSIDSIPSYECTVAEGKKGSIRNHLKTKLDIKLWWKYLGESKYSRGFIHENTTKHDLILLSLTSDYLKMVSDDLKQINKQFYIFTGSKDLAISLGFENNLMPYTEVFDGPNGKLRGTNRDFPQRTHVDFLNRLQKFGNFDKAFESVQSDMKNWLPPIKHNNSKKTDEEIIKLIIKYMPSYNNYRDLLRYFRYDLKIACEERRFKNLFLQIKES